MPDGTLPRRLDDNINLRKIQTYGFLDRVCQVLELTPTQREEAQKRYEAVSGWMAQADDPLLSSAVIYAQGSVAIGTTVKPIGSNEHDVDTVMHLTNGTPDMNPAQVKKLVGDRLKENGRYRDILVEKLRCWRIDYANEFHLDFTPAIPNPACPNGGELVPDKALKTWKASNPKGFKEKFDKRAQMTPAIMVAKDAASVRADAVVEPFPVSATFKGVLRRTVQILKRHRDLAFERQDQRLAPLSVIITQLAAQSYEYNVRTSAFENELDLLVHTVKRMTTFIEKSVIGGRTHYFVWNETTANENFAEKWNDEPERAVAFFRWHARAVNDLERLADLEGLDAISGDLGKSLGDDLIRKALDHFTGEVSGTRAAGRLGIAAGVGLAATATAARATPVRPNTFYGARD